MWYVRNDFLKDVKTFDYNLHFFVPPHWLNFDSDICRLCLIVDIRSACVKMTRRRTVSVVNSCRFRD